MVWHMPRHKHTTADGLSQRPRTKSDNINKANEVDINDFVEAELNAFKLAPVQVISANDETNDGPVLDLLSKGYLDESWQIARYLTTLKKPAGTNCNQFCA